jgi:hypothetical protein
MHTGVRALITHTLMPDVIYTDNAANVTYAVHILVLALIKTYGTYTVFIRMKTNLAAIKTYTVLIAVRTVFATHITNAVGILMHTLCLTYRTVSVGCVGVFLARKTASNTYARLPLLVYTYLTAQTTLTGVPDMHIF